MPATNVVPLHRGIRPTTIERAGKVRPSVFTIPPRLSRFERICTALGSRDAFLIYIGSYVGCMITVALAALWAGVLS
jgi:hypothetical protein